MFAPRRLSTRNIWAVRFSFAIVALFALSAYAENSTATANTSVASGSSSFKEKYLKNVSASHTLELFGASTQSLSGDVDGKGNAYLLNHYTNATYKFANQGINVGITNKMSQTFNKDRDADMLNVLDPYLTVSKPELYKNEARGISVLGYVRYYIPVSKTTHEAVKKGSPNDTGNGMVRTVLAPSKSFVGGKMDFSLPGSFYYRFAQNSNAEREALTGSSARNDMQWYYDPQIAWNFTPKAQAFVEYFSGMLVHNTAKGWSRGRKDPANGEYVGIGGNFFPNKTLSITPEIAWGPSFILNQGSIAVTAGIKLL